MTRFARAKGSKASNERAPENATPWAVMREQLHRAKEEAEHARLREQAEKQRLQNYENFLNERKTAKRKNTWCEFPFDSSEVKHTKLNTERLQKNEETFVPASQSPKKKKKDKSRERSAVENISKIDESNANTVHTDENRSKKKIKNNELNETQEILVCEDKITKLPEEKKKKEKSRERSTVENISKINESNTNTIHKDENSSKKKKKIKNNEPQEALDSEDRNIDLRKENKKKKKKNREEYPQSFNNKEKQMNSMHKINDTSKYNGIKPNLEQSKQKKKKEKQRRKPVTDPSFQIIINGRPVDLVRYDGFPVMKKDADRLQQLREDMVKKGIPRREVERTMKLERRRAEKALARIKRDVCYNCRKGGHNLSDCPDLRSIIPDADGHAEAANEMADGVCFKCGSTEHRQSECRVQKGQQFRFASCFICKEQGHIARQCPDNPKGLYPNGGACKLCGDVTHLRKDCPTTKDEKEETSVRLDTIATSIDNVEDFPSTNPSNPSAAVALSDKKPKKIKF